MDLRLISFACPSMASEFLTMRLCNPGPCDSMMVRADLNRSLILARVIVVGFFCRFKFGRELAAVAGCPPEGGPVAQGAGCSLSTDIAALALESLPLAFPSAGVAPGSPTSLGFCVSNQSFAPASFDGSFILVLHECRECLENAAIRLRFSLLLPEAAGAPAFDFSLSTGW